MGYDNRVVAFIDILGFKKSIEKSNFDETEFQRILTAITSLKELFNKPKQQIDIDTDKYFDADTQIIQVSDCLIISRLIQEQGGISLMLFDCALAIHSLVSDGFLCRGAIKFGNMYHNGTTIFGQAYIDALQAEKLENLPIVKFEKELFNIARSHPFPVNKSIPEWEINTILDGCKQLESGEYYLDYFSDYNALTGVGEKLTTLHYSKLRRIIVTGIKLVSEPRVYEKYLWAAKQFNSSTADIYKLKKIKY